MMGIGGPLNATILYSFNCCLETDNLSNGGMRLNEKPKSTQLSAWPLILHLVYLNTSLYLSAPTNSMQRQEVLLRCAPKLKCGIFHYCTVNSPLSQTKINHKPHQTNLPSVSLK